VPDDDDLGPVEPGDQAEHREEHSNQDPIEDPQKQHAEHCRRADYKRRPAYAPERPDRFQVDQPGCRDDLARQR
jgi:hypothetical protein